MTSKILVGCPTCDLYEYCLEDYAHSVRNLHAPPYEIVLADNSKNNEFLHQLQLKGFTALKAPWHESAKERIVQSRNVLRKMVLDQKYEWFFSVEMDVVVPQGAIERLLKHKEKIVAGLYYTRQPDEKNQVKMLPVAQCFEKEKKWDKLRFPTTEELKSKKPIPVAYTGLGCLLIHRSVLEKVEFRYKKTKDGEGGFDDAWFGFDAWKAGFKVMLDPTLKCEHLIDKRPWKWSEIQK
ncbi:MAG: hypothetical protein AABX70_07815 [Nanoarchaeota archaeon]